MKPDDRPTEARLFPLEANATADMDAKALDEIVDAFKRRRPGSWDTKPELIDEIEAAVRKTGRVI